MGYFCPPVRGQKKNNLIRNRSILIFIVSLVLWGCSQEKNTIVSRGYHNLTAHYNGFFNGRMALKDAHLAMKTSYEEDYTQLLPIFIYSKEDVVQPIYPDLDRAIAKTSLVVDRHSMDISGKEYCKWIDDTWMVMGEAQFLKGELTQAKQIFDFTKRKYEDPEIKQMSYFWLARVYTEQEQYERASDQLRKVKRTEGFPEDMMGELYAFRAYFYLKQNRREDAVEEMEKAVQFTKKRQVKTRRMFILAQLQRLEGNGGESSRLYAEVIKRNPDYEMSFYAKINRALAYDVTSGNTQEIKDILFKMLKDDKNIEYKDQIYYALAELELKQNNEEQGIDYLKLATKKSVKNGNAKGLAFYKLGDIYFKKLNYQLAQAYYDSTVTFLSTEHPDYPYILARANSLTQMMRDIDIVNTQDSLQAFVGLSEKEQEQKIDQIIDDLIQAEKEAERNKKLEEIQSQQAKFEQNTSVNRNITKGEWYFYNPAAVGFGASEFKKIWGSRKNEDDWRRQDKTSLAPLLVEDTEGDESDTTSLDGENDPKNPNYYKKGLPDSETKMAKSNSLIVEALYDLALVYKDQMRDEPKAVETFEELISRYDTSKYHPSVYYQLYLINQEKGNTPKADYYKSKLLNDYPNTDYAKVILNPNYAADLEQKDAVVEELYNKAYAYFDQGFYRKAYEYCDKGLNAYPNTSFTPQFKLLSALCLGYIDSQERMIAELEEVKSKYGNSEVGEEAEALLAYLKTPEEKSEEKSIEEEEGEEEQAFEEALAKYTYNVGSTHNFLLIVPDSLKPIEIQSTVANFNRKYFSTKGYKTSMIPIKDGKTIIVVSDIGIAPRALDYFNTFTKAAPENKSLLELAVVPFVISIDNYAHFYKSQYLDAYMVFFNENYLKTK